MIFFLESKNELHIWNGISGDFICNITERKSGKTTSHFNYYCCLCKRAHDYDDDKKGIKFVIAASSALWKYTFFSALNI